MSEKRSWDIAPSAPKKAVVERQAVPVAPRRFDDIREVTPRRKKKPVRRPILEPVATRIPTKRDAGRPVPRVARVPLGRRRRAKRKQLALGIGIGLAILAILVLVILWQPFLRVSSVTAEGPSAERVQAFVREELTGTRFFVIPRNSIFFLPESDIRAHILSAFPEVEAVSIAPAGLTALTVKGAPRSAVLAWCGTLESPVAPCYEADAQGFVFGQMAADETNASSSILSVYAPLAPAPEGTTPPLGSTIAAHDALPALIQFVKAIRTLGGDVVSVGIRGDEADLYTRAGTRITYVLGREQQALNLATSGFSNLNLNDGSLLYVDLRFDSKVFFKKR